MEESHLDGSRDRMMWPGPVPVTACWSAVCLRGCSPWPTSPSRAEVMPRSLPALSIQCAALLPFGNGGAPRQRQLRTTIGRMGSAPNVPLIDRRTAALRPTQLFGAGDSESCRRLILVCEHPRRARQPRFCLRSGLLGRLRLSGHRRERQGRARRGLGKGEPQGPLCAPSPPFRVSLVGPGSCHSFMFVGAAARAHLRSEDDDGGSFLTQRRSWEGPL
jgi:hypothetical protein